MELKPAFTPIEWARPFRDGERIPAGPAGLIKAVTAAGWEYRVGISKCLAHDVLRKVGDDRRRFDLEVDVIGVTAWSPGVAQWVYASWYRYAVPEGSGGKSNFGNELNMWNRDRPVDTKTGLKRDVTITEILEYVAGHSHASNKPEVPPAAKGKNDDQQGDPGRRAPRSGGRARRAGSAVRSMM